MSEPSRDLLSRASFRRSAAASPQPTPRKLSLLQMADFIERMATGCTLMDRVTAERTTVFLDAQEAVDLRQVQATLRAMAPYANSIRRVLKQGEADT